MLDLPGVGGISFEGKSVLVRGDFNVTDDTNPRVESIRNIISLLKSKNASKIKIIGHTETEYDLVGVLQKEFPDVEFDSSLRSNPGEKENDIDFAKKLSEGFNVYVNEAFSVSHREHASIVALPKTIKEQGGEVCAGLRFLQEISSLDKVLHEAKKPVVMVISGVKEDKLRYIDDFTKFADKILIGGRLPDIIQSTNYQLPSTNVVVADLIMDREDITIHSIEKFEEEIKIAGTIVVSGPIGKFEDEGHRLGTQRVMKAVSENENAFKVAGGGDTEEALEVLGLTSGFSWISVGGGAMLEYLANGTLPGLDSLIHLK